MAGRGVEVRRLAIGAMLAELSADDDRLRELLAGLPEATLIQVVGEVASLADVVLVHAGRAPGRGAGCVRHVRVGVGFQVAVQCGRPARVAAAPGVSAPATAGFLRRRRAEAI